jgi:hypothetical protein
VAQRIGSRIDGETTAIREEGASSDFFYFYFCADGSVAVGPFGRRGPPTRVRTERTPYRQHYCKIKEGWVLLHAN